MLYLEKEIDRNLKKKKSEMKAKWAIYKITMLDTH